MSAPGPDSVPTLRRFSQAWAFAGIILASLAAYAPALRGGFIWDDDAHVTRPDLRSLDGLRRIWFELGATQQYYPVVHSAFWVEHRLWGDAPLGYHLLNVLLHATAACLLVVVLRRLSVPGSGLAGFVFALHPVCVESVAWVSEEKNTLSTVFYLLAALAYLRWRDGGRPGWGRYGIATGLFVLALLSKSVTATLPAALLLVAWWRRGSVSWRRDIAPLVPWFAIALTAGLTTAWVERTYIGAQGAGFGLGIPARALLAGRVVWFYLGKLLWPADLVFIYPHWTVRPGDPVWWIPAVAAAAATAALAWAGRRPGWAREALFAWAYFCLTLFPALGFINVYPFIFSYVADHFQYLAAMGVVALAAAAWTRWMPAPTVSAAVLLAVLGSLTWRQCLGYRDAGTLYTTTLERNPDCWLAHLNLGDLLLADGRVGEALSHYRTAERLEPDYPSTHFNLGRVLLQQGRYPEAIEEFRRTLRILPADAEACNNLGVALADSGRYGEARAQFERAIRIRPDYPVARTNLARVEALLPPESPP
jgi:predicted negative regulator of RcsB-dependent stress response